MELLRNKECNNVLEIPSVVPVIKGGASQRPNVDDFYFGMEG